jgi:hypothetical protein
VIGRCWRALPWVAIDLYALALAACAGASGGQRRDTICSAARAACGVVAEVCRAR